jgi:hypothetical protein
MAPVMAQVMMVFGLRDGLAMGQSFQVMR